MSADALERLDDHIDEVARPDGTVNTSSFRIDDVDAADWAMRKLARIETERAQVRDAAQRRTEQVQQWLVGEEDRLDRDADHFVALLTDFHARTLKANPKGPKSVKLPSGVLTSRKGSDQWDVDPGEFAAWARDRHPELLRVTATVKGAGDVIAVDAIRHVLREHFGEEVAALLVGDERPHLPSVKAALKPSGGKVADPASGEVVPGVTFEQGGRTYKPEPYLDGLTPEQRLAQGGGS